VCESKEQNGTKVGYYDVCDIEDFMVKWLKLLIEVAAEVKCDDKHDYMDNNHTNKIVKNIRVLRYNSSRFEIIFGLIFRMTRQLTIQRLLFATSFISSK
jgi:hypothetical protein